MPTGRSAAAALERLVEIEHAVVAGQLLTLFDVTHGHVEVKTWAQAGGFAGVVHETSQVPAQYVAATPIFVRVLVHDGRVKGIELRQVFVSKSAVERTASPRDRSARDALGREDAISDLWTNKSKF